MASFVWGSQWQWRANGKDTETGASQISEAIVFCNVGMQSTGCANLKQNGRSNITLLWQSLPGQLKTSVIKDHYIPMHFTCGEKNKMCLLTSIL